MLFRQLFDPHLAQYAYLIGCQKTKEALLIDPERDIGRYVEAAASENLKIVAVAETHIHADFLSGVREFAAQHGVKAYLSDEGDADWKYGWADDEGLDVQLVKDGDTFNVGNIKVEVIHTPGHTPEHICFLITDEGGGASEPMGLVSGDFVFVGDLGRPDLLESAAGVVGAREPSAQALFESVQKLKTMPEYLQVWPGHGECMRQGARLRSADQAGLRTPPQRVHPISEGRREHVHRFHPRRPAGAAALLRADEKGEQGGPGVVGSASKAAACFRERHRG